MAAPWTGFGPRETKVGSISSSTTATATATSASASASVSGLPSTLLGKKRKRLDEEFEFFPDILLNDDFSQDSGPCNQALTALKHKEVLPLEKLFDQGRELERLPLPLRAHLYFVIANSDSAKRGEAKKRLDHIEKQDWELYARTISYSRITSVASSTLNEYYNYLTSKKSMSLALLKQYQRLSVAFLEKRIFELCDDESESPTVFQIPEDRFKELSDLFISAIPSLLTLQFGIVLMVRFVILKARTALLPYEYPMRWPQVETAVLKVRDNLLAEVSSWSCAPLLEDAINLELLFKKATMSVEKVTPELEMEFRSLLQYFVVQLHLRLPITRDEISEIEASYLYQWSLSFGTPEAGLEASLIFQATTTSPLHATDLPKDWWEEILRLKVNCLVEPLVIGPAGKKPESSVKIQELVERNGAEFKRVYKLFFEVSSLPPSSSEQKSSLIQKSLDFVPMEENWPEK